jgi:exodeoxyribonuclease VII small subunit
MSPSTKRSRPDAQGANADPVASEETLRAATFEVVMEELQAVVTRLEEGELSLEESLVAFELGVKLSREGTRPRPILRHPDAS